MQTLKIDIEDNKVDILLNLIKNLKDDVIKGYSLTSHNDKSLDEDQFFYERQKDFVNLRTEINTGKMKTYDFETSMDDLIKELES